MEPRSAAAAGRAFPYTARTTCYIEIHKDGRVTHGADRATYERAVAGESRLYAVWPGNWSSDLFVIDDLDEYAKAHGIKHDVQRTGLADHVHRVRWTESDGEQNPRSPYVDVEVVLDCGCTIESLGVFATQMREQKGWAVATSVGWSRSSGPEGTTYSLRVRRKSLAT
ncbi:hypothetical protein ABZ766_30920 [Streptomyces sp. NPDC006670]|uniref:hypothetical protein n=1 Tax=Streptomyces sp. NPDC006670 TaxID=3154476 RepID=UPI003407E4F1